MRTLTSLLACGLLLLGCASPVPTHEPAPTPAGSLADAAFTDGRYEQAVEYYTAWLRNNPSDVRATYRCAYCHEQLGKPDDALAGYARTLELEPTHVGARLKRAGLFLASRRVDEADADLGQLRATADPAQLTPHERLLVHGMTGQVALERGDRQGALDHFDRALELTRQHPGQLSVAHHERLLYDRAMALFGLGAFQMALGDYEAYAELRRGRGAQLEGDDVYHLVLLNYLAGRFEAARELLPHLAPGDRAALAARLDDQGFFTGGAPAAGIATRTPTSR